jgi:CBS domain containing-hemolysin-like protein
MTQLVFFALIALCFSFLCSILEAVLLTVTPSYVVALENRGERLGKILGTFKRDIDRPLAAILSLNTIAHTVGAAAVGAQAVSIFGSAAVGITSAILTILILVFSEIIPKTLGAHYWRSLAPFTAYTLVALIWILYPFVLLSQWITGLFKGELSHKLSVDELKAMADLGEKAGIFRKRESSILRNLLRFPTLQVKDIMTPRPVIFALEANRTVEEVLEEHKTINFSRLPVYLQKIDFVIGYVLHSDLLNTQASGDKSAVLLSLKRDILSVPATLPLTALFDRLVEGREHIALVIDEFGGTAGIATMEDVGETLLGLEIVDEADTAVDMQALARRQWKKRAVHLGLVKDDE